MVAALDGVTKEMAFESRPEVIAGMNHEDIWPKSISSLGKSKREGPEVRAPSECENQHRAHGWSRVTKGLSRKRKEKRVQEGKDHLRPWRPSEGLQLPLKVGLEVFGRL